MADSIAADDIFLAERVHSALEQDGAAVITKAFDETTIARAKEALERGAAEDEAKGFQVRGSAYDPDDLNLRVGNLPGKSAVFRELLELPAVKLAVTTWLGDSVRLSNFSSNTTLPGAGAMAMHADQNNIPSPWPTYPCAVNVAFTLDDFTAANATRYVPGSHHTEGPPPWTGSHPHTVPALAPAGSLILMEGRLYHQTGPNQGSEARAGAFAYFIRPFLAPQFEWHRGISRDLRAQLSPWLRELFGFGQAGGVAKFIPEEGASLPARASGTSR